MHGDAVSELSGRANVLIAGHACVLVIRDMSEMTASAECVVPDRLVHTVAGRCQSFVVHKAH